MNEECGCGIATYGTCVREYGRYREVTHGPNAGTADDLDGVRWMRDCTGATVIHST